MTMTIDANQHRFGPMNFDHHMTPYSSQPHFTNPWIQSSSTGSTPQSGNHGLFVGNQDPGMNDALPRLNLAGLTKHVQHGQHGQHGQGQHGTRGSSTSS